MIMNRYILSIISFESLDETLVSVIKLEASKQCFDNRIGMVGRADHYNIYDRQAVSPGGRLRSTEWKREL